MPNPSPDTFPRPLRAGLAAAALAVLVSCGGGTSLIDPFHPDRLVAFGDELSVLDDSASAGNGRKYTVNGLKDDKLTLDCAKNPLWIQTLAASYALVLPGCNPDAVASLRSRVHAAAGARVSDVAAQIDAHLSGEDFSGDVIVTVLAGAHDIFDQYAQVRDDGLAAETAVARVEAAGVDLARQVIRIAGAGGKVLIATVPDLGLSPFAKAEDAAAGDATRSALLTHLTDRFNAKMRVTLPNDAGRSIGLVLADDLVRAVVKNPGAYSVTNTSDPACDAAKAPQVTDCSTETLVVANAGLLHVWADDRWFSPRLQGLLGSAAVAQSRRNPF